MKEMNDCQVGKKMKSMKEETLTNKKIDACKILLSINICLLINAPKE